MSSASSNNSYDTASSFQTASWHSLGDEDLDSHGTGTVSSPLTTSGRDTRSSTSTSIQPSNETRYRRHWQSASSSSSPSPGETLSSNGVSTYNNNPSTFRVPGSFPDDETSYSLPQSSLSDVSTRSDTMPSDYAADTTAAITSALNSHTAALRPQHTQSIDEQGSVSEDSAVSSDLVPAPLVWSRNLTSRVTDQPDPESDADTPITTNEADRSETMPLIDEMLRNLTAGNNPDGTVPSYLAHRQSTAFQNTATPTANWTEHIDTDRITDRHAPESDEAASTPPQTRTSWFSSIASGVQRASDAVTSVWRSVTTAPSAPQTGYSSRPPSDPKSYTRRSVHWDPRLSKSAPETNKTENTAPDDASTWRSHLSHYLKRASEYVASGLASSSAASAHYSVPSALPESTRGTERESSTPAETHTDRSPIVTTIISGRWSDSYLDSVKQAASSVGSYVHSAISGATATRDTVTSTASRAFTGLSGLSSRVWGTHDDRHESGQPSATTHARSLDVAAGRSAPDKATKGLGAWGLWR